MTISKAERARRETVHRQRIDSAHRLARKVGDNRLEYDEAYRLLERCKNLSLAFQKLDEYESRIDGYEGKVAQAARYKKRYLLDRRADRLNEELRRYGCHMYRAWAIVNVYDWDFDTNTPLNDRGYLHFF